MNIRIATAEDVNAVAEIYEHIHDREEAGEIAVGWRRGVYPTRETARNAVLLGDLFVLEDGGRVVAAGRINREQLPEYSSAGWKHRAADNEVMVLHTLVVESSAGRHGYAGAFLDFYEEYARENGCRVLRIDTNERNAVARAMYKKRGFSEAGTAPCTFNALPNITLVMLEKKLD